MPDAFKKLGLHGRRKVYTNFDEINASNVGEAIGESKGTHEANAEEIEYLFNYYKGIQPILFRNKSVRPDITYNTVVNRASEIVAFKVSYLLSEPVVYISRNDGTNLSDKVNKLNDYMYLADKQCKDKELADDFTICGVAYRYVEPNVDYDGTNAPFLVHTLNPATTYVAYKKSSAKESKPVFAVTYVLDKECDRIYEVFTEHSRFTVHNGIVEENFNPIGMIPIIEYVNNEHRIGAFEVVIDLLDGMNAVESNRIEAVEQQVQSLLWFNDVEMEDDEIRKLQSKPSSVVFTRSVPNSVEPSIKNIVLNMQQADQQVLTNDLYKEILSIVGMPSVGDGNTSDSSNNGSTIVRNGWQHAEARAKDTTTLWNRSDKHFLAAALKICRDLAHFELNVVDVIGKFTRRNYEDIMTKSTVLTTLLGSDKVHPHIAYQVANIVPDPEEAFKQGMSWYEEMKVEQEQQQQRILEQQQANADKEGDSNEPSE